jgi:D-alanyl-D-alanine carboxypeptidase
LALEPDSLGEVVRVEGTVRLDTAPFAEYRSVRDPLAYSASLLRAALEDAGISVAGEIVFGSAPSDAVLLHEHLSLPLRDLVDSANRYSNNFMADQIALALSTVADGAGAADSAGEVAADSAPAGTADSASADTPATVAPSGSAAPCPANLTEAGRIITHRLRGEFGAGPSVRQIDGSGLSPDSRITGGVLARLLAWAGGDLRIGPDLAASLPTPGGDGTLRRRFQDGAPSVLRAKTGTMSTPPASGMAGYMDGPGTAPTIFVLLMNGEGPAWDLSRMKATQEAWVREYTRE